MSSCEAGALIKIKFEDGELECVKHDGVPFVSVKRVCEQLGVDSSGQRQKLRDKPWAVTEMISATGPDGKKYEQQMISVKSLPMWLATINPDKVAEVLRSTLVKYQLEAADVILRHFMPHLVEDHGPLADSPASFNERLVNCPFEQLKFVTDQRAKINEAMLALDQFAASGELPEEAKAHSVVRWARVADKKSSRSYTARSEKYLPGSRFGAWEVLENMDLAYAKCRCDCGTVRRVGKTHLNSGRSKSCGCHSHLRRKAETPAPEDDASLDELFSE